MCTQSKPISPPLVLVDEFYICASFRKFRKIVTAWCPLNCLIVNTALCRFVHVIEGYVVCGDSAAILQNLKLFIQHTANWITLCIAKCFHCFQQRSVWLKPLGSTLTGRLPLPLHCWCMWGSQGSCFIDAFKWLMAPGYSKLVFIEPFLLRVYNSVYIIIPSQNAHGI